MTILASSPASMTGSFYHAYRRALQLRDGTPSYPEIFAFQLPSWGTYTDWELTQQGLEAWPGGPMLPALAGPQVSADSPSVVLARTANPETFAVEFEADWAASHYHYLDPDLVERMFGPHRGERLAMQTAGRPGTSYVIHADLGLINSNVGIAVGHAEGDAGDRHLVFDHLAVIRPQDYPAGRIDLDDVQVQLQELVTRFAPVAFSVDQYNGELMIAQMTRWARGNPRLGRTRFWVRTATAQQNMSDAELFKATLGQSRLHAPYHRLARDELVFLEFHNGRVDHPKTGEVKTKDVTDSMMSVAAQLLDGSAEVRNQLSAADLAGGLPGGFTFASGYARTGAGEAGMGPRSAPSSPARGARMYGYRPR